MLDFVRKAFRGGLEVILWINLILSTVIGGIGGYYLGQLISYRNAGGFAFGGVIIGIILGLLTDIVGGGFIATILNMDENLEQLKDNMSNTSSSISQFIPSHRVKLITNTDGLGLRKKPNTSSDPYTRIPNSTEVQHLSTGDEVSLNDIKGFWYEIITKERVRGWCFSGSLEKI